MNLKALKEAAEKATPGEWRWLIHDHSMASLGVGDDPGMGDPLVLNVSPCRSCADRAKAKDAEWEWGRCTTPSEEDARYIALANPSTILSLIERVEALEEFRRDVANTFDEESYTRPGSLERSIGDRARALSTITKE